MRRCLSLGVADLRYARESASWLPGALDTALGFDHSSLIQTESGTAADNTTGNLSTFTGWGSPCGALAYPANAVAFFVNSWDPTMPVRFVRVQAFEGSVDGALLADALHYVGDQVTPGVDSEVTVPLGATIPAGTDVYLRYCTDGRTGRRQLTSVQYPAASYPHSGYFTSALPTSMDAALGAMPTFKNTEVQGPHENDYARFLWVQPRAVGETCARDASCWRNTNAHTVTGWGGPFASSVAFNRVEVDLLPVSRPVTSVAIRVRTGDHASSVLADQRVYNLRLAPGLGHSVGVDLPDAIQPGTHWLEILADAPIGYRGSAANEYPVASGYAAAKYTTAGTLTTVLGSSNANQISPYARLVNATRDASSSLPSPAEIRRQIQRYSRPDPVFLLPSTLYAYEGVEHDLYFDNTLMSPSGGEAENDYRFDVTQAQSLGVQQNERYTYTPLAADAATRTLRLDCYRDAFLVGSWSGSLVIKAKGGGAVSRKLLLIGDSTTDGGTALAECVRLAAADGSYTLTTVGTQTDTVNDSGGTPRTVYHEGQSGKTVGWYYTDVGSPFVFAGAFNFATYLSNNAISLAADDWAMLHLGINDLFSAASDSALYSLLGTMRSQIDGMVASVKAAVSGVRVGILLPIPPSKEQDAFGANYGVGQTRWRYRRNRDLLVRWMIDAYDTAAQRAAKTYVFSYGHSLDTRNNMQLAAPAPVNPYNATTTVRQSNGVHPAASGYYQMGAELWAVLKGMA